MATASLHKDSCERRLLADAKEVDAVNKGKRGETKNKQN